MRLRTGNSALVPGSAPLFTRGFTTRSDNKGFDNGCEVEKVAQTDPMFMRVRGPMSDNGYYLSIPLFRLFSRPSSTVFTLHLFLLLSLLLLWKGDALATLPATPSGSNSEVLQLTGALSTTDSQACTGSNYVESLSSTTTCSSTRPVPRCTPCPICAQSSAWVNRDDAAPQVVAPVSSFAPLRVGKVVTVTRIRRSLLGSRKQTVARILERLARQESREANLHLKSDYRQAYITVSFAYRGDPDPFRSASIVMYGCLPEAVFEKLTADRHSKLGAEYGKWYSDSGALLPQTAVSIPKKPALPVETRAQIIPFPKAKS